MDDTISRRRPAEPFGGPRGICMPSVDANSRERGCWSNASSRPPEERDVCRLAAQNEQLRSCSPPCSTNLPPSLPPPRTTSVASLGQRLDCVVSGRFGLSLRQRWTPAARDALVRWPRDTGRGRHGIGPASDRPTPSGLQPTSRPWRSASTSSRRWLPGYQASGQPRCGRRR